MSVKILILVDTNVVVYAYDRSEQAKQQRAAHVLDILANRGLLTVSTQVLAEFFVTVTRRITVPLTATEAYGRLENFLRSWNVIDLTGPVVLEAARGVRDYQFSYWDAQVWALARLNQITTVFSEDFNTGAVIEGVRFVNPFTPDFQISDWIG
jgi:predicted nucleic acid-binding protein